MRSSVPWICECGQTLWVLPSNDNKRIWSVLRCHDGPIHTWQHNDEKWWHHHGKKGWAVAKLKEK